MKYNICFMAGELILDPDYSLPFKGLGSLRFLFVFFKINVYFYSAIMH